MDIVGFNYIVYFDVILEFDNENGCNIWEDWILKDNLMSSYRIELES